MGASSSFRPQASMFSSTTSGEYLRGQHSELSSTHYRIEREREMLAAAPVCPSSGLLQVSLIPAVSCRTASGSGWLGRARVLGRQRESRLALETSFGLAASLELRELTRPLAPREPSRGLHPGRPTEQGQVNARPLCCPLLDTQATSCCRP